MSKEWIELIGKYELEGARSRFEQICSNLYKRIHSRSNVRKVDVKQGDGGIDIFIGEIGVEPISVIQCKFFPNGIGNSQKNQIRKSFDTVISSREFEMIHWTLCIINTLDLDENKWWSTWKSKMLIEYDLSDDFIDLRDGDDLILLLSENSLYNIAFEKEAPIKIDEIHKSIVPSFSIEELKNIFKNTSFYVSKFKNYFGDKPDTHIERPEAASIITWIDTELSPKKKNILVIEGEKGNGKTVIVKDVYDKLLKRGDLVLCIKSDKYYDESPIGLEAKLFLTPKLTFSQIKETIQKHNKKLTVIIDQLDALSQTLSSDRQFIQTYNRVIAELEDVKGIRLIISTRSFDLQYDANLSIYNSKDYTKVKVDRLSDNEVTKVLNTFSVLNKPKKLIELLKTPNHLEIFCKLPNKQKVNIDDLLSLKDLFDELWKEVISSKSQLSSRELLYKIADDMYESGQRITVPNKYNDTYYQELVYLKSNQILIEDNNEIQFFHQTLYDYCFSRQFIDNGNQLQDYILENRQSLYIRSVIKMIIEYLREADSKKYINTLNIILLSPHYRFHVKTLLLATLGLVQNPTEKEKFFITTSILSNEELKDVFLLSVQSRELSKYLIEHKIFDRNLSERIQTAWQFFRKNVTYHPIFFVEYLERFDDFANIKYFIEGILSINDNWKPEELLVSFEKYITFSYDNNRNNFRYYDMLKKIADYHFDFAIAKLKSILLGSFEENRIIDTMDHYIIDIIEKMSQLDRSVTFKLLLEVYNHVIEHTRYSRGYDRIDSPYYFSTKLYPRSLSSKKKETIEDYLINYTKDLANYRPDYLQFYNEYKDSNSILILILLMEGLKTDPSLYVDEIFDLINIFYSKNALKADDDDFQFLIRKLLGCTFVHFSEGKKHILASIFNSISAEHECIEIIFRDEPHKRRIRNTVGRKKYLFLSSLPYSELSRFVQLKRNFQELRRKFGQIRDNRFPDSDFGIAGIVGPPLSQEAYKVMSLDEWKNSMLKFNEEYEEGWMTLKGGIYQHAHAFTEVVKQNPEQYYQFLEQVFETPGISKWYILYGLEGLLDGIYDITYCKSIFKKLLRKPENTFLNRLIFMSSHFITSNTLDEEIFSFLKRIATSDFFDEENGGTNLTERDQISIRGEAIGQIITCYQYNEYRESIFSIIEELVVKNITAINLAVVRKLAYMNHVDINRAFKIFKKIVDTDDVEILKESLWSASYFNNNYHFDMSPYFEKIIKYPELHRKGNTLILSWIDDEIDDRPLYEKFIAASKDAKLCALHIAEHNLFESAVEINEKSLSILFEFLSEEEGEDKEGNTFADAYSCIILRQMKDDKYFPLLFDFFDQYSRSLHCKNSPAYFLQFLIKCSQKYPLECLSLLKNIDFESPPSIQNSGYYSEEPIQLLLAIYSGLSQKPHQYKPDKIEESLNLFDHLLKHSHLRDAANTAIEMVLH